MNKLSALTQINAGRDFGCDGLLNSSTLMVIKEPRMREKKLDWKPDLSMPVGKGATVQRFIARIGDERLEIDTEPWG